jgi:flagellar assembly protein FliH
MVDVERQAQRWLAEAHAKAAEIIETARHQAADIKRQAHDRALLDGYTEGHKKGVDEGRKSGHEAALAEARKKLAETHSALTTAVQQLDAHHIELRDGSVKDIMHLAIAIAGRLARRAASIDPDSTPQAVHEALKFVVEAGDISICIHPTCLDTVQTELPRIQLAWPGVTRIHLVPDDTVAPGGCIVRSACGSVDLTLDTQLQRIASELLPTPSTTQSP